MGYNRIGRRAGGLAVLLAVLGLSACDFKVSNPGPVQDNNINLTGAHQGLINGAIRATGDGLGELYVGASIVHDFMASGHTGTAGVEPEEEVALLTNQRDGSNGGWADLHRGRWIGEEAIRRFTPENGVDNPESYDLAAQAHLWSGIATRILGENMCTAAFDGGEALPKSAYFERAIEHFDEAIKIGNATGQSELVTAATGARAAANLFIGNGSAARTDAMQVPFDFKFTTQYSGFSGDPNYYLFETVESLAFQSMSMWGTPAHPHFLKTGDSRVAWGYDNGSREVPEGKEYAVRAQTHPGRPSWSALIPMYYPLKGYAPRDPERELLFFEPVLDDQRQIQVNLVTGREMALVIAESYLMEGNWQTAMDYINQVRTSTPVYPANLATAMDLKLHPQEQTDYDKANLPDYFTGTPGDFSAGGNMPAVSANSLDEAWTRLKFERYLELNLEMRRLGDRWRWRANNTPGDLDPLEYVPAVMAQTYGVPMDQLNLCMPLTQGENDANGNIPDDYQDWISP